MKFHGAATAVGAARPWRRLLCCPWSTRAIQPSVSGIRRPLSSAAVPEDSSSDLIERLAMTPASPLSLKNLYQSADIRTNQQRIFEASWLHRELPIRMSQRIEELRFLPCGLSDDEHIRFVTDLYTAGVQRIVNHVNPSTPEQEASFAELVASLLSDNVRVPQSLAHAVHALQSSGGADGSNRELIDASMERFFMARIGLRFLVDHYLRARQSRQGWAGVIESKCNPHTLATSAAAEVTAQCQRHLGTCPPIEVIGKPEASFTYVSSHCHFILSETLKNACCAVVDTHGARRSADALPPIKIIIAEGKEDFTFKVADEGGGFPRSSRPLVWSWFSSTQPLVPSEEDAAPGAPPPPNFPSGEVDCSTRAAKQAIRGFGFALPLARVYARYFGGDLDLRSMQGFGTDAYIHLNRLGTNCENMPELVKSSPAEGDSTWIKSTSSPLSSPAPEEEGRATVKEQTRERKASPEAGIISGASDQPPRKQQQAVSSTVLHATQTPDPEELNIDARSIDLVVSQANCSRPRAIQALAANGGDITDAILQLTM